MITVEFTNRGIFIIAVRLFVDDPDAYERIYQDNDSPLFTLPDAPSRFAIF